KEVFVVRIVPPDRFLFRYRVPSFLRISLTDSTLHSRLAAGISRVPVAPGQPAGAARGSSSFSLGGSVTSPAQRHFTTLTTPRCRRMMWRNPFSPLGNL